MKEDSTVGNQIEAFLRAAFTEFKPSWIVTVERKGTALLRTLVESPNEHINWIGWDRVVSSKALKFVSADYFREGIVLVLDDGIHSGYRISNALAELKRRDIPEDRIRVAVFSVHENSKFKKVDMSWYKQLSRQRYWTVRESVIEFFQQRGSLLLDTEHIEVPVNLNCGRLEFFNALCNAGVGVEYISEGGRHNLTINDPIIVGESEFLQALPPNTLIDNVMKKIRVVERDKDSYAIIPIFYPSVFDGTTKECMGRLFPCLSEIAGEPLVNSQLVSVYASIRLLQTAFTCLRELINQGKVQVAIPTPPDPGDTVSHLKAIFPAIDLIALHKEIEANVEAGRVKRLRKSEMKESRRIDVSTGNYHLESLRALYWQSLQAALKYSDSAHFNPNQGASFREIVKGVKELPLGYDAVETAALLGTAVDIGIDEAKFVSDILTLPFSDGKNRFVRVLKLDGEIVLSDVRRANANWRFPFPPPTKGSPRAACV